MRLLVNIYLALIVTAEGIPNLIKAEIVIERYWGGAMEVDKVDGSKFPPLGQSHFVDIS